MGLEERGPGTIVAWGGEEKPLAFGAAQTPVVLSAPFAYPDVDSWLEAATGRAPGYIYSRNTNPTVEVFEQKVRLLEGGEAATSFASGMAAISNTLFALLRPGDRVVSIKDNYGGTSRIMLEHLPGMGVDVTLVDTEDAEEMAREVARGCKIVYLETPTNPTIKIVDIASAVRAAKAAGAITIVDNTFATPINQLPLKMGADLVVHSATKFLGGHDDALGGVLVGAKDLVKRVYSYREITGAALGAFPAYLLLRGLKTLELRVQRQNATATAMADMLAGHRHIERVFYPSHASHSSHSVARSQMKGFGGVLSFQLKGDASGMKRFLAALQFAHRGASLGSVNTLAGTPATTSHVECTPEQRRELGIPESLVRYSCGVEDPGDLMKDVENALRGAFN